MSDELEGFAIAATNASRRTFLKFAGTGFALSTSAASYARIVGANDRVRVGILGFSERFRDALLPAFQQHAAATNFEIVALSDIWSLRRADGIAHLKKITGKDVVGTRNNAELLDRKDVDAVIVATADFQHAQHGVAAVGAGRDAYIEKPLANTMSDAQDIRRAVHETGKIVQIGTQRRSAANYRRAKEFIASGQFGDIVSVEMTWNVNQPGRWRRPALVEKLRQEDTDWKLWLGNRPFEPFDPRKYLEFRLFWPYSSGIPDQWMVHQIDTVHWFAGFTASPQCRCQRRSLCLERRQKKLGHHDRRFRLRSAQRSFKGISGRVLVAANQFRRRREGTLSFEWWNARPR